MIEYDGYDQYKITDEDFARAVDNATEYGRERLMRKMKSNAGAQEIGEYVKNFVWRNKDKMQ